MSEKRGRGPEDDVPQNDGGGGKNGCLMRPRKRKPRA